MRASNGLVRYPDFLVMDPGMRQTDRKRGREKKKKVQRYRQREAQHTMTIYTTRRPGSRNLFFR